MISISKLILLGCLSFVIGAPVFFYATGYRPPECCVRDHAIVYQVIEREQPAPFASHLVWDVYYNVTTIHRLGMITVNCDYYKVGMAIELIRNVQKSGPANYFGTVANGTDFSTLVNPPSGC